METNGAPAMRRTGRNCSRSDGIRGGAVTGPWRSAGASPAPAKPPVAAPQESCTATAAAIASGPAAVLLREQETPYAHQPDPRGPAASTVAAPAPARPARASSQRSVWLWTAFGLAISSALIVAALLFRPEPPATPAAPATSEASAAVMTPAPPASGLRINLRVGPDTPSTRHETIVAALSAAGYDLIEVHVMPFPILRSRVGFFDETDRAAAESLAAALAPLAEATGGPLELRDYGGLEILPAPGRLDLWIGG